ncbi:hypothetical protein [Enhygromyxa salina]|uniref:Lipoprotein n=1 Tax=Enhygromyxa salina TaxID=215803 RepID=A0A2S9YT39_9BACT|nr:hypothetical protein [Enhygromyxa salina]PRQ08202.1 hypothetical protein ENSA7_21740 [Enhygromyxa salina]
MKIKLDSLHLTILAALGLACASRPALDDDGATTTTSNGTAGTDTTGGTETGGVEPHVCENPEPILQAGTELPSGFVRCDDGFIHRREQLECVDPQGADAASCASDGGGSCQTGADCIDHEHGRCVEDPFGGCLCEYGCATDADCAAGLICACAGVTGDHSICIPAHCTIDDECGEGLCGLSEYEGCCGTSFSTACAAPDASCHVDSECGEALCDPSLPESELVMYECAAESDAGEDAGDWTCKPPGWCGCDCGRPFFVDGEARVAATLARADWCDELRPRLLDARTRQVLAARWSEIAAFEHASVASFARFGLQLMQLGAPPQLLRDNQRALADEIVHARLAFGLASAYAGGPVGPGGLDVGAALERETDLRGIVEGLIVEACMGETLAAIEAHEAALWAEDPVVAAVLEQIAADEWRHAQLGWRSLAWILDGAEPELRRFALFVLEAGVESLGMATAAEGGAPGEDDGQLRAHGLLDPVARQELRRAGVEAVIGPCVAALRERLASGPSERWLRS